MSSVHVHAELIEHQKNIRKQSENIRHNDIIHKPAHVPLAACSLPLPFSLALGVIHLSSTVASPSFSGGFSGLKMRNIAPHPLIRVGNREDTIGLCDGFCVRLHTAELFPGRVTAVHFNSISWISNECLRITQNLRLHVIVTQETVRSQSGVRSEESVRSQEWQSPSEKVRVRSRSSRRIKTKLN